MRLSKHLVVLFFSGVLFFGGMPQNANAMSFAEYVYQSAQRGDMSDVRHYMQRGYNIDATNSDGYTALCYAVENGNYQAYQQIRMLGADVKHRCMEVVNADKAKMFEQRYAGKTATETFAAEKEDSVWQYAAVGGIVAGGAAAVALWANDDDDDDKGTLTCPIGEELVDGKCVPIECPEGTHLVGNVCVEDPECPTGQRLENGVCVPIVCPDGTHLVGDVCVGDDIYIENTNDNDVWGINSPDEDVYNLYSTPLYPDDEGAIVLKNKGDGDVTGVYGLGNVYNSLVSGKNDYGMVNPYESGTGSIVIENEGSGNVYGLFSRIEDVSHLKEAYNAYAVNEGVSYGKIDITNTGGGSTFGVFGDVRAYNARGEYGGKAYGDITIHGDGNIYGLSGYAATTNAVSPFFASEVIGNINIYSEGNGDIYGMMVSKDDIDGVGQPDTGQRLASWFAFNAYASGGDYVEGNINIHNTGDGDVYGMYGGEQLFNAMSYGGVDEEGNPNGIAKGTINIVNLGDGDVYGMYSPEGYDGAEDEQQPIISNTSSDGSESIINLVNTGDGVTTGLRGGYGSYIENSGEININNLGNGTAIGIYAGVNSNVLNSGSINIYREEFTDSDGVVYSPDGSTGGTAYGIYAESGATITNSGTIEITGAEKGTGIYLEKGATLENTGDIIFNGSSDNTIVQDGEAIDIYGDGNTSDRASVNLDDLGGEVILGEGGRFFADTLSGNMSVSEKSVMGSFKDEYVLTGALQAENTDELDLHSKSAMFEASSEINENGGYDVVMTRKNFNDIINDGDISDFLEKNYQEENGSAIYDNLKSASSESELYQKAANTLGTDVLPNFYREDALVYRNLSRQFNENLFNRPDENYFGGYKYMDISTGSDGILTGSDGQVHAAYGMVKNKTANGLVYGAGISAARLDSDYDNGSSRKSNIFGLWLPLGYDFNNGLRWYSKLYAGYADGSYDRLTDLAKYSSDYTQYQYGISNEVRYSVHLGNGFMFEPVAELNMLGIYQDGFDEGNDEGALKTDSENSMSAEGGLGAYLSKNFEFSENSRLGLQIGGVYYVEFLDNDDKADATLAGFNDTFTIRNRTTGSRAALSARIRYDYRDLSLYGNIEKETGGNDALLIDAGVQYKF